MAWPLRIELSGALYHTEQFVEDMLCMIQPEQSLRDIPKPQKRAPARPLEYYESLFNDRKLAMATDYLSGHYTLEEGVGNSR
jgi:putative transposase